MKTYSFYYRITLKNGKQERSAARYGRPETALATAAERAMLHAYDKRNELAAIEVWHLQSDGTGKLVYRLEIEKAFNFEHINA